MIYVVIVALVSGLIYTLLMYWYAFGISRRIEGLRGVCGIMQDSVAGVTSAALPSYLIDEESKKLYIKMRNVVHAEFVFLMLMILVGFFIYVFHRS